MKPKIKYKIVYVSSQDQTSVSYINAYSEEQAKYLFRLQAGFKIRILSATALGQVVAREQLSLF